jgi:ParB-like chromosome segregation protein Spo0J
MSPLKIVEPSVNEASPSDWRKYLPVHPACDVYPELSRDELIRTGNDIRKHGLRFEVVVNRKESPHKRYHDEFQLIDGRSRLDAMAAVGLKFEFKRGSRRSGPFLHFLNSELCGWDGKRIKVKVEELTEEEVEAYVASANLHRRHLTAEEKHARLVAALKATPELSNAQIGKQTGRDDKTVAKVRRELESNSEIPNKTADRVEASGRKARGRKPSTAKAKTRFEEAVAYARQHGFDLKRFGCSLTVHNIGEEGPISSHTSYDGVYRSIDTLATVSPADEQAVDRLIDGMAAGDAADEPIEVMNGAGLGARIEREWSEAKPVFEVLTAHTIAQLAQVIPSSDAALVREIAGIFAALAAKLGARPAGNGEAPVTSSLIPSDLRIPGFLDRTQKEACATEAPIKVAAS